MLHPSLHLQACIYSHMYGRMYGCLYGHMCGRMYGRIYGRMYGHKHGRIYGRMYVRIYGRIYGRIRGRKYGRMYGPVRTWYEYGPNMSEYGTNMSKYGPNMAEYSAISLRFCPSILRFPCDFGCPIRAAISVAISNQLRFLMPCNSKSQRFLPTKLGTGILALKSWLWTPGRGCSPGCDVLAMES